MARSKIDPVQLEVFHHLLGAYCEEAGARLRLSAISPNIRERADYSVAVFDRTGALVSQAAHIPVHLGSAGDAVRAVRDELELEDGDVAIFPLTADPKKALKDVNGELEPALGVINMGNSVYSTPIVANNVLYIANKSTLFAIKAPAK